MAEPTCPKCSETKFDTKTVGKPNDRVVIVYCENCGHIVGVLPHPRP